MTDLLLNVAPIAAWLVLVWTVLHPAGPWQRLCVRRGIIDDSSWGESDTFDA